MSGGYVRIHRRLWKHPAFRSMEERAAWVWLISHAAWKETRLNVGGQIVTVQRGQFCTSLRQLGEAWGWDKMKVNRFLRRLKSETMIETASDTANETGRTFITICNYDEYQADQEEGETASETAGETGSDTEARHKRKKVVSKEGIKNTRARASASQEGALAAARSQPENQTTELWQRVRERLAGELNGQAVAWLELLTLKGIEDGVAILAAPSVLAKATAEESEAAILGALACERSDVTGIRVTANMGG